MENFLYGIAVKVRNLDLCRAFYRDVLDLGSPQLDSNFWVEFKLGEGASLTLERILEDEELPDPVGRISWLFKTEELESVLARLRKFGYEPKHEAQDRIGVKVYEFRDPEGNPFLVCANAARGNGY